MRGFAELPNDVFERINLDGWVRRRFSTLGTVIGRLIQASLDIRREHVVQRVQRTNLSTAMRLLLMSILRDKTAGAETVTAADTIANLNMIQSRARKG
jgi:predicted DNA-binding ribbon-helix-helix protein